MTMLWLTRHGERRALRTLDDRLLLDIGLSAGAARAEGCRMFWHGEPREG